MFTGLVFGLGLVNKTHFHGTDGRISITSIQPILDWKKGESIAVNGACLSVETFQGNSFTAYASSETLQKTNLRELRSGDYVNLERALLLSERLGGHIVTGHIDGLAHIAQIESIASSLKIQILFPEVFAPFVISKGSVCLDGISLTINSCTKDSLEVNVIPESRTETTISSWRVGKKLNFEVDVLAKYVEHQLGFLKFSSSAPKEGISLDFLKQHGF